MQFTYAAIVFCLAGMISAAPENKPSRVYKALPIVHAARAPQFSAPAEECGAGSYHCTGAYWDGGACDNCAISVGNANGQCQLNNLCRESDGSCQYYSNGQPYCT